ncbi:MAG: ATP-dependent helicase [Deltaproteobacteria bacterium]|nr:ATP-dependent helicase [Deltaproteobacteria bacterium]
MAWYEGLSQEQREAASHLGGPARLLAGPGTGKTRVLTRRICFLIEKAGISPSNILVVTFTRPAAQELRDRIEDKLGADRCPHISTLHSFALRQLLRNPRPIIELPQPLRVADDWEERNIIRGDLQKMIGLKEGEKVHVKEVDKLMKEMSSDWQSLKADEESWDQRFPDSNFLDAWEEHRKIYGYTLRDEMIYRLKKALEQPRNFDLVNPISHFLVDEYQDLNRCDLEVIRQIALRGAELFVAGDDDQSIYGFRKAHPEGIRRFCDEYEGSQPFALEICKRCDRDILSVSLAVIKQDRNRLDKAIRPESDKKRGQFAILRFKNQKEEARNIAEICSHFVHCPDIGPGEILILLRSNRNNAFSLPIQEELERKNISVTTDVSNPLDSKGGRAILAFMRLAINPEDNLAWRTLFETWCKGVKEKSIRAIYDLALMHEETFAQKILNLEFDKQPLPNIHQSGQSRVSRAISKAIQDVLNQRELMFPEGKEYENSDDLMKIFHSYADCFDFESEEERDSVFSIIETAINTTEAISLKEAVRAVEVIDDRIDQEFEKDHVRILSMHRAKGLTSKVVIIAAAEDQYIPGSAQGEEEVDALRLMYVSLTRAKHSLFVTCCDRRTGSQQYTGSDRGRPARRLSRFLSKSKIGRSPENGKEFVDQFIKRSTAAS